MWTRVSAVCRRRGLSYSQRRGSISVRVFMKRIIICLAITVALAAAWPASGAQFLGGKGFIHTNSALVLPPGALDFSFYARGYFVSLTTAGDEEWTLYNGCSALATTFGFTRRVELGFTQILYQDLNLTHRKSGDQIAYIIPGDTYLRFKVGGYSIGSKIFWGFMPILRYRVGLYHDIHLEPYESNGVEVELVTLWSYYDKPLYPGEALSIHLNLGFLHHNDQEEMGDAAQSMNFLLGAVYPMQRFDLGLEIYGSSFITQPDTNVLGREDWIYATPFARYKLFKGLYFTMGVDVLLQGDEETSWPSNEALRDYPNYSNWRITGRINFAPSTAFYVSPTFVKVEEAAAGRERWSAARARGATGDIFDRQSLFRWAIEERGVGVEAIDLDLEKIRQERIKAEEELKKLKRKLEEKQRKSAAP